MYWDELIPDMASVELYQEQTSFENQELGPLHLSEVLILKPSCNRLPF